MKNRHLKISCPGCGYTARVTRKWLSVGLPTCPCGVEMEHEEKPVPDPRQIDLEEILSEYDKSQFKQDLIQQRTEEYRSTDPST